MGKYYNWDWDKDTQCLRDKDTVLKDLGCKVEPFGKTDNLLVNDKFVIAINKKKFKIKGKNVWYQYGTLEMFHHKYILGHRWDQQND